LLYELLSGARAFGGDEIVDTLASILTKDPNWDALPPGTPRSIRTLLRRCLEKDPKRRLHDIADARIEIDEALASGGREPHADAAANREQPAWRRVLPWAIAAMLSLAFMVALWAPWRSKVPAANQPTRLTAELGANGSVERVLGAAVTISPDGALLAFAARSGVGARPQLFVRRLNELQATLLPGTEDAHSPFFSPDGQSLGFFAGTKLKKVPVTGGTPVTLSDAPSGRGATWAEDGTILFSPNSQSGTTLLRVSASGGAPESVTTLADGEVTHRWPQVLPGGKTVLYTSSTSAVNFGAANLVVQTLPNGPRKVVQRAGYYGRYLLSGHLVYVHEGRLFAAPFDLDRLEESGPAVPALEQVTSLPATGGAQFEAARNGTLVYQEGQNVGDRPIHWMDRDGTVTPLRSTLANWFNPQFSPDGRHLALQILEAHDDIWVYEWDRDTLTRLTTDPGDDVRPAWTADSRRITFASARADKKTLNLYWQRADGTGDAQRLTESRNSQVPGSWHPSGRFFAFEERILGTRTDLMILPMAGDEGSGWKPGTPTAFLNSGGRDPKFSPDGRWIAYTSNETGRNEVYVRPFPGPGGKWQISTGGGAYPVWSRAKHEIFYAVGGELMVASFAADGDAFRADKPRSWSTRRFVEHGGNRSFDLHPDGLRFALEAEPQATGAAPREHVTFFFNFFDELRRIAPVKR
jgi:serine/threonine-protein kinase